MFDQSSACLTRFISITTGDDEGAFDGSEKVFEHIVTKSDDYRDLDVLRDFVEAGALKPVVASRFTLEELGEACESLPLAAAAAAAALLTARSSLG